MARGKLWALLISMKVPARIELVGSGEKSTGGLVAVTRRDPSTPLTHTTHHTQLYISLLTRHFKKDKKINVH